MKKTLTLIGFILLTLGIKAQSQVLKIEDCYQLARKNYPLTKQHALIEKTKEYSIQNAAKGYLPQINIFGQATYQSAVTSIPVKIQGLDIPTLTKDQYKAYVELDQTIYDAGTIKNQQRTYEANAIVDSQKLEVELYKLKSRINDLFFGTLLLDGQILQNELHKKDIELGLKKTEASVANGVALKSSADLLKAELLQANQNTIALKASRKAYLDMLGLFINQPTDETTVLAKPGPIAISQEIKRPELLMYDYQNKSLDIQDKQINAAILPRLNLFLQGGAGRPGLDMLKNSFDPYYIGGIRLNWSLSGLYTQKKQKLLVDINRRNIDLQKETFLFNTNFDLRKQNADIAKLQQLIASDDEIIDLRTHVKNTSLAQLENGVINTNDYLTNVNAEDNARQNKILNEIQLLMTLYQQQTTTGN
ncbi:MAG: TolC family protein [Bacteroidetes bacterium]|nr:TolC family protein [Bacteroidota bacterium]